jgi:uncharacterized protein (DUF2062 family)
MRKLFRRFLPDHGAIHGNRWLAPFHSSLLHPRLWHMNRRSAAGGVAVGLLCGLVPGPFQIISSALLAVLFRVNLPLSFLVTFYTNPFTIVPLYLAAFSIGQLFTGSTEKFTAPPDYVNGEFWSWLNQLEIWVIGLGKPLAIGLPILAIALAAIGYGLVRLSWHIYLRRVVSKRQSRRAPSA